MSLTMNRLNTSEMINKRHRMLSATKDQAHFHSSNTTNQSPPPGNHAQSSSHNSSSSSSNQNGGSNGGQGANIIGSGSGAGANNGTGSVQVKVVPSLRSTVAMVEKELVQNKIHRAELIATNAINIFLDDPTQFRHLAATASTPKVVQSLTPFWTLVTLLVQCKLLAFHQGIEENGLAASEFERIESGEHSLGGDSSSSSRNQGGPLCSSRHSRSQSFRKHQQEHEHNRSHSSPATMSSSAAYPHSSSAHDIDTASTSSSSKKNALVQHFFAELRQLEGFLPKLFERLEAVRPSSVPPQARILQTQVLRGLKRHHEALLYMEDHVLGNALCTSAFVSDSDNETTPEGGGGSESSGEGGEPESKPTATDKGGSAPSPAAANSGRSANTPMPTETPRNSALLAHHGHGGKKGKSAGGGSSKASVAVAGTPRYAPVAAGGDKKPMFPTTATPTTDGDNTTARSIAKGKKKARTEKRSTRILSWTPKTILAAIELYISICFESSSISFNLGDDSGQQEPVAAEEVTVALDLAEKRCIEFLSAYADSVNSRLRPCFPFTMDSPSVFDEVLSRVESMHEQTLQLWNHQQMSYVTNPVQHSNSHSHSHYSGGGGSNYCGGHYLNNSQHYASGPDTPPHRPYDHNSHGGDDDEAKRGSRNGTPLRQRFPSLPLAFGGGNSGRRSSADNLTGDDAPATDRGLTRDSSGSSNTSTIVRKVTSALHTLQEVMIRLWNILLARKKKLGYAAIGGVTLITVFMLISRLVLVVMQGQRGGGSVAPVSRIAAAPTTTTTTAAAAGRGAAVARRIQAF